MSRDAVKKLKPCPFCGSAAYLQQCPVKGFRAAGTRITFQVGCMNRNFDECPLRPAAVDFSFPTEQAAIEAWNKRAALASRDTEVREVLAGLSYQGRCWCVNAEMFDGKPPRHHEYCHAAQTLYEKVKDA